MKDLNKLLTGIVYVGQLGLDLAVPILLCLGLGWFLNTKLDFGVWIYFPCMILGLGGGGMTFWKFYTRIVMKGVKKPDKSRPKVPTYSKHI
ncbi:AtpZ/AtpI family protein [Butyrivibrio sp. NC3005]|uniref:AtpZ/AtpI family protein n=1 Tax=Butyrivibrio sp. NC3005 TaxID=1280685 RepID=UPI00041F075A|nr:AtpZ/AtpI family protein [Butyrivibrio sp. NC3005]